MTKDNEERNMSGSNSLAVPISIVIAALIIAATLLYLRSSPPARPDTAVASDQEDSADAVLPSEGMRLPIRWGDTGVKLAATGVIDGKKFIALHRARNTAAGDGAELLLAGETDEIRMTEENAPVLLNVFWALGLGTKSSILEQGPMADPRYGGAAVFASTGGWTLAAGDAMTHYSRHPFVVLTAEEQAIVERMSGAIYRPCCNNPTSFPDCNHGMAMLGLLELMASQGVPEREMWKIALQANAYWFPNEYRTIAGYFARQGIAWEDVDPATALGSEYSSASGYRRVKDALPPAGEGGGGQCST